MSNPNATSHAVTPILLTQDRDPNPNTPVDHRVSLQNLSLLRTRMDSLHQFLSKSINTNTLLTNPEIATVSNDIVSAIHQIIVNGAALVSYSQNLAAAATQPDPPLAEDAKQVLDLKTEVPENDDAEDCDDGDCEIVELDAMELLVENIHFCEICGKGFRRDANLRMHMRAHGDRFKTLEALAKPATEEGAIDSTRRRATTRFSCPFEGCNRNKLHKKFKALKSMVCVKNHFKRSHCPKMYSCDRCQKKNFAVVSDLRSHMKQCGESKWKCSCGTTFSRKDKLFGHMALFEGHMPALGVVDQEEKGKKKLVAESDFLDDGFFDDLDSFTSFDFPLI